MRAKAIVVGLFVGLFVLSAQARPTPTKSLTKARVPRTPTNPTGLGTRTAGLKYVSVSSGSFVPAAWIGDLEPLRFTLGLAPLTLPDGARLREVSCFGNWDIEHNGGGGDGVRVRRKGLYDETEILAKAKIVGGTGIRRLDAKLDHVVDNFANAYWLELVLNGKPNVRGCRVGYEPAP